MKTARIGSLAVVAVVAVVLAGCGGSDDGVVNGCVIEPGTGCANIDLSGADLEGVDLTEADLSGANLTETNLRGANLTAADLSGAQIVDADLSDANLQNANLTGATIVGTNLDGATLCGTIRVDGSKDDSGCPSTETTAPEPTTESTETAEPSEAEVTSFELTELDCGAAGTGPVTVTWETEAATAVEIAVDVATPTAYPPSGTATVVVACDGEPHAITITPQSDAGPGVPETKEVQSG